MNPVSLIESRLQLHYAIQFMAAATALLPVEADFGHIALEWNASKNIFQTKLMPTNPPIRVALTPGSLTSLILNEAGEILFSMELGDRTIAEGFQWLKASLENLAIDSAKVLPLAYPTYDFPFHPIAHGASFAKNGQADRESLLNFYRISFLVFQEMVAGQPNASPIRIWPHHFDMAVLLSYPEEKSIGIGLSPGDQSSELPYWYISPWPYPPVEKLPTLSIGTWHTLGWTGAILTADLADLNDEMRAEKLREFVHGAIAASQAVLGVGGVSIGISN